ncbi:phospholipase D-like domain-containing protein [Thiocapsa sp.]|uniref:phospholipase D-like domain-containing protein n=1 Tax=Thiocapsa sp. TaxID=2024551 RepID=UPI0035935539
MKRILLVLLALVLGSGLFHALKPLPPGIGVAAPLRPVNDVEFLADHTWVDDEGDRHTRQVIFDRVFELIQGADRLLVLDMFLFNAMQETITETHRPLSRELTENLLQRMRDRPGLIVVVITDPFNSLYGGVAAPHLDALEAAGAHLAYTDLGRLRDPNPLWSAVWRLCCKWLGNSTRGWLPNPVGEEAVTLRTYLALLNLKANHRKTLVADEGDDWVALVTSANPHDASSAHVNTAVVFRGQATLDLLETETAVIRFSAGQVPFETPAVQDAPAQSRLQAQIITESRIREAALDTIRSAARGDRLDIAMFYFSHEGLIRAVKDAAGRGVDVRILLDPNRDAFGREKSGIPNRQTGRRFHETGIPVRWCHTTGEQCHAKQLVLERANGQGVLITGSSNFTRRNLDDFNLETNVLVEGPADDPFLRAALTWFDDRWRNEPDWQVSDPYDTWEDRSKVRSLQAWIGENLGWSSF